MKLMQNLIKFGKQDSSSSIKSRKKGGSASSSISTEDDSPLYRVLKAGANSTHYVPPKAEELSSNCDIIHVQIVRDCFRKLNSNRIASMRKYFTEDFMWYFYDCNGEWIFEMGWDEFAHQVEELFASFPDMKFRCHTLSVACDGTVKVSKNVVTGTHTGEPFGFGPFEKIAATGKAVHNDPEDAQFHFRQGKICRVDFHAKGSMTGPMGFYTQLGGFPAL